MIKISYDMPGLNDVKELNADVVLVSWDSPREGYPVLSQISMLASVRNIGPCFGLFIKPDGSKNLPVRVAGTLITSWEPENPAALIFEYQGHNYRVMINFFKIIRLDDHKYQCDFVINGLRPHNDPANIFVFGMSGDSINLESLKELLAFDLTVEEEAVFNSEGGFTLKRLDEPQEKKEKKIDKAVARLNNPVDVLNAVLDSFRQAGVKYPELAPEPIKTDIRQAFLKAWMNANSRGKR